MRLALIGDIHQYTLRVPTHRLFNKRLLGHANLYFRRRFRFNHLILDALFDKVQTLNPDLLLCSGDVTTTSLEDEFAAIEAYFRPISEQMPVIIVPGNHDRYTFKSARHKRVEQHLEGLLPRRFPHHRRLNDRWHLVALDAAIPQLMLSRGMLGRRQLRALERRMERMREDEGLVILCHYPAVTPPGVPNTWSHGLVEAKQLRKLIARCKARVVFLHGHIHRPWRWGESDGRRGGPVTCINAGSPAMISRAYPLGQGFWEINLPDNPQDPLDLLHHVPVPSGDDHINTAPRRIAELNGHLDPLWTQRHV